MITNKNHKFDVRFDSDTMSDRKGFKSSYEYCFDYISMYNGTNESYFEDYKGGTVSIIDIDADERIIYSEEIK